ncbi:MAG: hypothetical protein WA692_12320 [Paraburkholderia caledonica]
MGHHLTSCAVRVAGLYHELRQGYLGFPEGIARLLSRVCDRSYAMYLVNGAVIALGLRLSPFNGMDRANTADLLWLTGGFLTCTLVMAELTYA